jgi:hypothetical protein
MFRTNKTVLGAFVAGMMLMVVGDQIASVIQKPKENPTMNDRIIADTKRCEAAGLGANVQYRLAPFWSDEYYVVCKPVVSLKAYFEDRDPKPQAKPEKQKFQVANPDSFEAKSKATQ